MTTSIIVCEEEDGGQWYWLLNDGDDDVEFHTGFAGAIEAVENAMECNSLIVTAEAACKALAEGTTTSSGEIVVEIPDRPPFRTYPQRILYQIDQTVNPVGAECVMRLQYGVLSHLHHGTFVAECAIARSMEKDRPGCLRELAKSYGMGKAFDEAERIIAIPGVVDQKMIESVT